MTRWLHLARHATTEDVRPGHPDRDRRLTAAGQTEASRLAEHLRACPAPPEQVWCSPAERARTTAAALGPRVEVVLEPALYRAGPDEVLELVAACDPVVTSLLVVGHNPTMAALAQQLATGPAQAGHRFPPASCATCELDGPWADVARARLVSLRLP